MVALRRARTTGADETSANGAAVAADADARDAHSVVRRDGRVPVGDAVTSADRVLVRCFGGADGDARPLPARRARAVLVRPARVRRLRPGALFARVGRRVTRGSAVGTNPGGAAARTGASARWVGRRRARKTRVPAARVGPARAARRRGRATTLQRSGTGPGEHDGCCARDDESNEVSHERERSSVSIDEGELQLTALR